MKMTPKQEEIDTRLIVLRAQVNRAQQENKQGWSIKHDLKAMRRCLEELEALDEQCVQQRRLEVVKGQDGGSRSR